MLTRRLPSLGPCRSDSSGRRCSRREAYSSGVYEYDCEDCCDGYREGAQGPSVAGAWDAPGRNVCDDLLDLVADMVDGGVVGLVVRVGGAVSRVFSSG